VQGKVYQIVREGRYGEKPHLYVVVLQFTGSNECLVVPAFGADGIAVNDVIQSYLDQGYRIDQVAVELDNAAHITFAGTYTGKRAHWLVADADRLPSGNIANYKFAGTMNSAGLKAIAEGILNYSTCTNRFSANLLKKLRQLRDTIQNGQSTLT